MGQKRTSLQAPRYVCFSPKSGHSAGSTRRPCNTTSGVGGPFWICQLSTGIRRMLVSSYLRPNARRRQAKSYGVPASALAPLADIRNDG
jgi:hypothetical protein